LAPDAATVRSGDESGVRRVGVVLHSDQGFTVHEAAEYSVVGDDFKPHIYKSSKDLTTKDTAYYTDDPSMAERMTHAWHDAIVGCGGKAVSKSLY
jgi:hypothetical protein